MHCLDASVIRLTLLAIIITFLFALLIYSELNNISTTSGETSLVLVHVLFRHGKSVLRRQDRNVFSNEIPCTLSELSNGGKNDMFELGYELRRTYSDFINNDYEHEHLKSICLDTNVSKESLQLVLAGLFPPKGSKKWSGKLNWQPIPYAVSNSSNMVLNFMIKSCPKWLKLYEDAIKTEDYMNVSSEYSNYFEYLSNRTMIKEHIFSAFLLDYNINAGQEISKWEREIYPEPTKHLVKQFWRFSTTNDDMKRIVSGALLKKMLNESVCKLESTSSLKIQLFSGEEYNMEFLLRTIGVESIEYTEPGAYLALEVYRMEGSYFLKLVLRKSTESGREILEIPYCGKLCPLYYFIEKNRHLYPTAEMCEI